MSIFDSHRDLGQIDCSTGLGSEKIATVRNLLRCFIYEMEFTTSLRPIRIQWDRDVSCHRGIFGAKGPKF